MIKGAKNSLFIAIVWLLAVFCSCTAQAYFQDHITVTGPSKIAVGKPNLEYSIIPDINGPFTIISCLFCVYDDTNLVSQ
ncbi:hypothetical protein IJS98_05915, partial [bacterium]|nr:hypothetical protein [bacterium]